MCQPITPPQPHPHPFSDARTPRMQQNLPGCLRTKAHSPTTPAAFSLQLPHPCHAPRSINLSPTLCQSPLQARYVYPQEFPASAPCPDLAAPSCVRNVHTDPHTGVPLLARPSLLCDSEAGGCPLDPTSDSSGTRPCSGCLLLVNLKAALPGAEAEQIAAAQAER